jgi:hypothetical protein
MLGDTKEQNQATQSDAPIFAESRPVEVSNHIQLIYDIVARRAGKKDSVKPAARDEM